MMIAVEEKGFYWALVYGEEKELTVVQFENGEFWLVGAEFGIAESAVKIIAKIEPPPIE